MRGCARDVRVIDCGLPLVLLPHPRDQIHPYHAHSCVLRAEGERALRGRVRRLALLGRFSLCVVIDRVVLSS